jgi:hypothetical protein
MEEAARQAMPELWACHLPAWQAFVAVASQWRPVIGPGGLFWPGLDYAGAEAGFRLAGIAMTPDLWDEVRLIEGGAREALNEVRQ